MVTIDELINHAAAKHPDMISLVNFTGLVRRARVRKRQVNVDGMFTTEKYGQVIADVPAVVAHNLQQPDDKRDLLVLIHIPREVADEAYSELTSPIISPASANGNLIVTP